LLAAAAVPAYGQAPTLTLDEAVRLAVAGNRDLSLAAGEVDKAAHAVDIAKTAKKPRFNASFLEPALFTHLEFRLGALGTLDLPRNFAFAIGTATQPISQLYDIGLGVKASGLSKDLASERLRAARQTVIDEVKRAYYGILRAESGLTASREAIGLLREAERLVDTLVAERAALKGDLLDVQARRARQEHDLLVLEDTVATGRERLNVALGRDPQTLFALERLPLALPAEADLTSARAAILDRRPDVRQARITIDLAKTDWQLKKAEQRPRVGALFSYVGNINMPLLPGNIAAAVIQASWEPFDWGRKGYERATKQIAVQQAETLARQLEATVAVDLNARGRALREARSLIRVTELANQAAQERLRVVLDRRNEQAVLLKDVLLAQVAVAEADHNYQAALLSYWEARADFEKALAVDR
jgi:outer membrane protein TolC